MEKRFDKFVDNFFTFSDKVYLGVGYRVVNDKLAIFTTEKTLSVLIGEIPDKISFEVDKESINIDKFTPQPRIMRSKIITFSDDEIYLGLCMLKEKYKYPEIAEMLDRSPLSTRAFFYKFQKENNINEFIEKYNSKSITI